MIAMLPDPRLLERRYSAADLAGIAFDPRSSVAVLAHALFLARYGQPCARVLIPGVFRAAEAAVAVWGALR